MRKATGISVGLHGLLGLAVIAVSIQAPPPPAPPPLPPAIAITMARLPVPVPAVAKPVEPPKPVPAVAQPVPPVKPVVRKPEVKPLVSAQSVSAMQVAAEPAPPAPLPAPAAVESPTTPAPAGASGGPASPDGEWLARLRARIERGKRYPPQALKRREEGTVLIRFVVARDGTVLSATLARGSGSDTLDREAVELPGRASPLPPMPDGMAGARMELTLPVGFALH